MNSVEIIGGNNSIDTNVFNIYTTTYFLTAATTLEEHKLAPKREVDSDEL